VRNDDVVKSQPINKSPFQECLRLLLELHALSVTGQGNSPEAAVLCGEMELPWDAMSDQEQERLRGLSTDLYSLQEGPKQIAMTPQERHGWAVEAKQALSGIDRGDYDTALTFLRRPIPKDIPSQAVFFLQARCWERLGVVDAAILFVKGVEHLFPNDAVFVLLMLMKAAKQEEATVYANRIIDAQESTPSARYIAASVLVAPTQQMAAEEASPILERVVMVLREALKKERAVPYQDRDVPRGEAVISSLLGLCLERLGRRKAALTVYQDALKQYPDDPELLTMRGIAKYESATADALKDFEKAAEKGAASAWPYFFLANAAVHRKRFLDAWNMSLRALERRPPDQAQAQLHEWLAISRFMLGQPVDLVLEGLENAERLGAEESSIRRWRAFVEARASPPRQVWADLPQPNVRTIRHTFQMSTSPPQDIIASEWRNRLTNLAIAGAAGQRSRVVGLSSRS
jgi:tetratricopeptide (TPR) repeat protein